MNRKDFYTHTVYNGTGSAPSVGDSSGCSAADKSWMCLVRLSHPGFKALGHQSRCQVLYSLSLSNKTHLHHFMGHSTCAISFKHALYLGCTALTISACNKYLPVGTPSHSNQHHTEIAVITHCSTRCYAGSGRQECNIHLSASFGPCYSVYNRLTPVFSVSFQLQSVACWEIEVFQLSCAFLPSAYL